MPVKIIAITVMTTFMPIPRFGFAGMADCAFNKLNINKLQIAAIDIFFILLFFNICRIANSWHRVLWNNRLTFTICEINSVFTEGGYMNLYERFFIFFKKINPIIFQKLNNKFRKGRIFIRIMFGRTNECFQTAPSIIVV